MSKGRSRSIIPDLDTLESPLLSPTPLTGLAGVPGSAIAEKIFNDPHSWDDTSGDEGDYPEDIESDTLAWFTEEIEKIRRQSVGIGKGDYDISRRESKETDLAPKREGNAGWKDIARRGSVRPISLAGLFEQSDDDFSKEIQQHLSKILDSVSPKSSSYTTGSTTTPSTAESIATPPTSNSISEISPSVYPASATLSFLEYYGIYPDSPLFDGRKLPRKKSMRRPPLSKDVRPARAPAETFAQSSPPRLSSVPPPGLDLPFQSHVSRPLPPGLVQHTTSNGLNQESPSHSRKNSDVQEVIVSPLSDSTPRSRPLPIATGVSPPSSADSSPVRVRRLPSIPSEPQPQVSISQPDQILSGRTTPPSQSNAPASVAFLSPPSKSSVALTSASLASAASQSLRTPITIRSPLGAPLGPRTRGRSSDAGRQLATIQPC